MNVNIAVSVPKIEILQSYIFLARRRLGYHDRQNSKQNVELRGLAPDSYLAKPATDMKLKVPPIGRRLAMTVIFGVDAPSEHLVNGYTFIQMLYDGVENISFRREGDASIFEAEKN